MEPNKALSDIRRSLHELAQPLAAVTGIVDLMLLEQQGDSPLYEDIHIINERLEKVLEIVAHIQAITRAATRYGWAAGSPLLTTKYEVNRHLLPY
jgi:signal transduction histidine kinase